jgi:hypothetical protein
MNALAIFCAAVITTAAGAASENEPPVKEFVRGVVGAPPYEKASGYGKDLDVLLNMLKDKDERRWWPNIATTICFIGDKKAVRPLIQFVEGDAGPEDETSKDNRVFDARKAAVSHMGVIANKTGDPAAIKFLSEVARADPAVLSRFKWLPKGEAAKTKVEQLAVAAVNGLAVSGKKEAGKVLESIQKQEAPGMKSVQAAIGRAIKDFEKIRGGTTLENYFNQEPR